MLGTDGRATSRTILDEVVLVLNMRFIDVLFKNEIRQSLIVELNVNTVHK